MGDISRAGDTLEPRLFLGYPLRSHRKSKTQLSPRPLLGH